MKTQSNMLRQTTNSRLLLAALLAHQVAWGAAPA
jgi:hypothetical protein